MDKLCISLQHATVEGVAVAAEISSEALRPRDAQGLDVSRIAVSGTLVESGNGYVFHGQVSGVFRQACDRCLDVAERPFRVKVLRVFVPDDAPPVDEDSDADEDDADACVAVFSGDEIDLKPVVWEEVVLAAPAKFLCRDDCVGLCPVCGTNRNHAVCVCKEEGDMRDAGLSGLAEKFPELRPKRLED